MRDLFLKMVLLGFGKKLQGEDWLILREAAARFKTHDDRFSGFLGAAIIAALIIF